MSTDLSRRLNWFLILAPIMAVAMVASAVHGFTLTLVAFVFEHWGYDAHFVGLNAAIGSCGFLLLGPFLPGIVTRYGLPRIVAAAIALGALALAGMAAWPNVVAWFVFKALLGLSLSIIWGGAELWINLKVDDAHRGRAFSLFTLFYWLGFACGPGIIGLVGTEGALPLLIGTELMLAAFPLLRLLPYDGVGSTESGQGRTLRLPLWSALMVLAAAIVAGMGDGSLGALLPTFGIDRGIGEAGAIALLTAFVIGGVAAQWPVGWLADKVNERVLTFVCIAGAGICLALLPQAANDAGMRLVICFITGGLVMSISTLGCVMVGRVYRGTLLAVMSTWFSVLYEIGATVGPVVAGVSMLRWGADGLPLSLALASGAVCLVFLIGASRMRAIVVAAKPGMPTLP